MYSSAALRRGGVRSKLNGRGGHKEGKENEKVARKSHFSPDSLVGKVPVKYKNVCDLYQNASQRKPRLENGKKFGAKVKES
ncbi:hypothetical protein CEXT_117081 [Caerostris extrusa]|uniref:Uncharacterized protein n=1 Tax=Caerostris extrusa TaxID=172846 RepID=A0AAV4QJ58_CAEEX|nr:hypothetical protein CEXT_117081 [Caerostris extrusa]